MLPEPALDLYGYRQADRVDAHSEVTKFGDLVYIAADVDQFVAALRGAAQESDPRRMARRLEVATEHTWPVLAERGTPTCCSTESRGSKWPVNTPSHPRIAWIIPSADAGGIDQVIETTAALAANGGCEVTLIETHAAPRGDYVESGGLRRVALDMEATKAPASIVLDWLRDNPQRVLFTNGVSHLERIFPYIPDDTLHVAVLHDAAHRYRHEIAVHAPYLDGVVAVSDYVFGWAHKDLQAAGFKGMVRRIHNGTSYPPPPSRSGSAAKLRLLFIGNIWHKGGSRLVGIAKALQRRGVNFQLTVIADQVSWLQRRFARVGLKTRERDGPSEQNRPVANLRGT